tara:strand:+ start:213 stop:866 length:654 start_codon:yes stop_codon:yes gene_type:complete
MSKIIGISGVAGSGKDTFFEFLSERLPCKKFSLADELKKEVRQWTQVHYHIDSIDCPRDDKEIIRPFLVFHGTTKRHNSQGRHWIEKLNDSLLKDDFDGFKIITDIRYDDYENDEVSWLKDELNGTLVHVSQYEYFKDVEEGALIKKFREPVNSEEARNDPRLKQKSDFQIEWEFIKNGRIEELSPYVDNFINWLLKDREKGASRFDPSQEDKSIGL